MALSGRTLFVAILAGAVVSVSLLLAVLLGGISPLPEDQAQPRSFTFGAVGDLGSRTNGDMLALAKRLKGNNASFLMGLGDLGYAPDEELWCAAIKSALNDTLVIAGNHDVGESQGGNITEYVDHCPFTLDVPLVGGPGTSGYGYEYYFDFPRSTPLGRFILITAGVHGRLDYDYSPGSDHYIWVVDAVQDARDRGIPWVVVGMHKQCIGVGPRGCTMGQAMFDKLVDLRVDLILHGHEHVYHRSHQLALGENCASILSGGSFDPDCVVDDGTDGDYPKGNGSVIVINGAGGASLYDVTINGSNPEIGYFAAVMGGNENTQGRLPGFGAVIYRVSLDVIEVRTDFCPTGSGDATGKCDDQIALTFRDDFVIRRSESPSPGIPLRSQILPLIGPPSSEPLEVERLAAERLVGERPLVQPIRRIS